MHCNKTCFIGHWREDALMDTLTNLRSTRPMLAVHVQTCNFFYSFEPSNKAAQRVKVETTREMRRRR